MKILLFGYGKMGCAIEKMAHAQGISVIGKISKSTSVCPHIISSTDVCIDFSSSEAVLPHLKWACELNKPIVIGTTGWEEDLTEAKKLVADYQNGVLYAPNFSLGMAYFIAILKKSRAFLSDYDVAGVEYHHIQKKDSPSGTAKEIAKTLGMNKDFSSVRCGSMTGKHEILFDSPFDQITFTHEAKNRDAFAHGALKAALWLKHKKGWFTLDDFVGSLYGINHSF